MYVKKVLGGLDGLCYFGLSLFFLSKEFCIKKGNV